MLAPPTSVRSDQFAEKVSFLRLAVSVILLGILAALSDVSQKPVTFTVLALNVSYSATICVLAHYQIQRSLVQHAYWLDLIWYAALVSIDFASLSVFELAFLFVIVVAAISHGLKAGLRVTIASVLILITVTLVRYLNGSAFDTSDAILISYPLILGFLISYASHLGNKLERRLDFLKQVAQIANPRFGIDQTVDNILGHLKSFYESRSCLLIMNDEVGGGHSLYRVNSHAPAKGLKTAANGLAHLFLSVPSDYACIWSSEAKTWRRTEPQVKFYDMAGQPVEKGNVALPEELVNTLDADSFISVPIICYTKFVGRIYVVDPGNRLSGQDVAFLNQVMENVMRVMENIRLVDRLATEAADFERKSIARDIHDSIVQPYIGIQMGLSAVKRKVDGGRDATKDINRLIEMAETEIADLRRYMTGLRGSRSLESSFVQAVSRFASKFGDASGIGVEVAIDKNLLINDRLAAEAFQIVAEGLSNIRRHTQAKKAFVHINCRADEFMILIRNDKDKGKAAEPFLPRSISERAVALGGRVSVHQGNSGTTALQVSIPL